MTKVVETLLYNLKAGTGADFDKIMRGVSIPLHERVGMDVISYGSSLHDPDAYFLIRSYDSLDHLTSSQAEFYRSDAWRSGPREAIIEKISASLKVITELPSGAVDAMRRSRSAPS